MASNSTVNNNVNEEQPPGGISKKDWTKTPIAVREFIISLLNSNQQQGTITETYKPKWPAWVMLLANFAAILVISLPLVNKVTLQCIVPRQVSELSVAFILLIILHLIWRAIGIPAPSNVKESINLKYITIPVVWIITFLNEIHPWRLSSRMLVFLLIVFLILGSFLNLTPYSPFHRGGDLLAIPSFEVLRQSSQPPEQLAPGRTLTINPGEKVFIKLVLLGETKVSCTWFTASGSSITAEQDCTLLLDVPVSVESDILTAFIQPVCGSRKESASLNVIVQP